MYVEGRWLLFDPGTNFDTRMGEPELLRPRRGTARDFDENFVIIVNEKIQYGELGDEPTARAGDDWEMGTTRIITTSFIACYLLLSCLVSVLYYRATWHTATARPTLLRW